MASIEIPRSPAEADITGSNQRDRASWLMGLLATLILSVLCTIPIAAPSLPNISAPWGAGDMTYFYFMAWTWDVVSHAPTSAVGYPFGLNPNAFAGLDGLLNLVAKALSALFGNPYIGLNLLLLLSFPLVAVLAYMAIRLVGLTGPLAVALANAFTFIPFHFGRGIGHLPLGLMIGLTTGVLLALMIGSGRLLAWSSSTNSPRKIRCLLGVALLVITTAWTGLYYAFFGLLLVIAAVIWRIGSGDRWRQLLPSLVTTLGLGVAIGLGLLPVLIGRASAGAAAAVSLRDPMDSVLYAGNLAIAVIPQPYSILSQAYNDFIFGIFAGAPPNEAHLMANFGSWVTSLSLVVFLVGLLTYRRSRYVHSPAPVSDEATESRSAQAPITFIAYLLAIVVVFFVPWGMNYLFSSFATAQIRAWNRLLPYILFLLILGASAALASWRWPRQRFAPWIIACAIVLMTVVDMVLPWRNLYTYVPEDGQARVQAAYQYAAEVNAAIPESCGVLTLPFVPYPGAGPRGGMDDYDHFTIAMTNPEKSISYGALTGSASAATFERLSNQPIASSLWELRSLGYCAVHIDRRGYEDAEPIISELRATLGEPVSEVGSWTMFEIVR